MKNILKLAASRVGVFVAWVSPPRRLFAFVLGVAFVVSIGAWVVFDKETSYILYFPTTQGTALRGEIRDISRRSGTEARARELVAEFLLGPANPALVPAFPAGTSLDGLLYRKGTLYVDIGQDAALLPEADLKLAIAALKRTVGLGIHQAKRVVVTIGGIQPWAEGLVSGPLPGAKKP